VQELRALCDTTGTDGTERKTQAQHGVRGRRTSEAEKRISEVVLEQEEIGLAFSFSWQKSANSIKE
jgi:hypothetical protein